MDDVCENDEYVPVFLTDAPVFASKPQTVDKALSNMQLIPSVGSVVISEKTSQNSPKYNSGTRLPTMDIGGGVTSADADARRRKGAKTQMQYTGMS